MTSKILAWEIEKYAKVLYVYIYIKKKKPGVNRGKMILNCYNKYTVQFHVISKTATQVNSKL